LFGDKSYFPVKKEIGPIPDPYKIKQTSKAPTIPIKTSVSIIAIVLCSITNQINKEL